jgi:hypothetical protein
MSFTNVVAEEGNVVTIRIYEAAKGSTLPTRIIIVEDGKSRVIELEPYNWKAPEQNKNLETINGVLEQYKKAGFKIESGIAMPIVSNNSQTVITYILTK